MATVDDPRTAEDLSDFSRIPVRPAHDAGDGLRSSIANWIKWVCSKTITSS